MNRFNVFVMLLATLLTLSSSFGVVSAFSFTAKRASSAAKRKTTAAKLSLLRSNRCRRHTTKNLIFSSSFSSSSSSSLSCSSETAAGAAAAAPSSLTRKTKPTTTMNFISGMSSIVDQYDLFLLDMWGVMHDGSKPYEGVLELMQELKSRQKRMVIVSNSSKRLDHSIRMLQKLGFQPTDFEKIITSGEVAFHMLSCNGEGNGKTEEEKGQSENTFLNYVSSLESWSLLKQPTASEQQRNVFMLGSGDGDETYLKSSGWTLVPTVETADLILAKGTFTVPNDVGNNDDGSSVVTFINKRKDPVRYEALLQQSLQQAAAQATAGHPIPMLISNPDKVRPDTERPPMPGKLGNLYEQALQDHAQLSPAQAEALVKRIGKPFQEVYQIALQPIPSSTTPTTTTENGNGVSPPSLVDLDLSRVCMIGDALETDIAGAAAVGIDSVWVLETGIYAPDLDTTSHETLVQSAHSVLNRFNQEESIDSYAKGRTLYPTYILPVFQW